VARISRHQMFMEIAQAVAKRSTCARLNVGAVVVVDKRVVAIGYNGPEAGQPHCSHDCAAMAITGCTRAVHAEVNAMHRIPASERDQHKIMYVTDSPCKECTQKLIEPHFRLDALFYCTPYREMDHLEFITDLYRILPSGFIINHHTGQVMADVTPRS